MFWASGTMLLPPRLQSHFLMRRPRVIRLLLRVDGKTRCSAVIASPQGRLRLIVEVGMGLFCLVVPRVVLLRGWYGFMWINCHRLFFRVSTRGQGIHRVATTSERHTSRVVRVVITSQACRARSEGFLLRFRFGRTKEDLMDFRANGRFIFRRFIFGPINISLIRQPLSQIRIDLLRSVRRVTLTRGVLIGTIRSRCLRIATRLLLPTFPGRRKSGRSMTRRRYYGSCKCSASRSLFFFVRCLFCQVCRRFGVTNSSRRSSFRLANFNDRRIRRFLLTSRPLINGNRNVRSGL